MSKKRIFKLALLLIGMVGIFALTGCHATQSGYLYDENYPYPYPAYYSPHYYPYPYYYPHVFFGSDILIIQRDQNVITQPRSSGPRERVFGSGSSGSGGRSLSSSSSTEKRSLKK